MNLDEYTREHLRTYEDLAVLVAEILRGAITEDRSYRLQQVQQRAKKPASLLKKLEQRQLVATQTLETDIKDLAGCRVIFYTNSDVTRFINSGIVGDNFEILEAKLHYPQRPVGDAASLYMADHYVVTLKANRTDLREYARFAGVRCEIQIQTTLNHAWAEMEHDIVYKAPALNGFGGREFDGIKARLHKVMRKYLLPAGYEFQKIASDIQRLVDGKTVFDGDALQAIVDAENNNTRLEAIERFADHVLPYYDDLPSVYSEVTGKLLESVDRARACLPVPIETPYGSLPAKTVEAVISAITKILTRNRYVDVGQTFDALVRIYAGSGTDKERKSLMQLGTALAEHQLEIWRKHGPIVQLHLLEAIQALPEDAVRAMIPLLSTMLEAMLSIEVKGTTSTSTTVTFHTGTVAPSDALSHVRTGSIGMLRRMYAFAGNDPERRIAIGALKSATHQGRGLGENDALQEILMHDTRTVVEFLTSLIPGMGFDLLQTIEAWVHRKYWVYHDPWVTTRDKPELEAARVKVKNAAEEFRRLANSDPEFEIYKTLVGYDVVVPPAWEQREFDYKAVEAHRFAQVDILVGTVDVQTMDAWFDRLCRHVRTESNDAATFIVFTRFVEKLAEVKPDIALAYVDRLEGRIADFLPWFLIGLSRSSAIDPLRVRIDAWLAAGHHIARIAQYLGQVDTLDEALLGRTLLSAIRARDIPATRCVLRAAGIHFSKHPGTLIETVFLPAVQFLTELRDLGWVRMPWHSWYRSAIVRALNEEQASTVLDALIAYPQLEYDAEHITAAIAERWPAVVLRFMGKRQAFARTDAAPRGYDAIPFEVHALREPLASAPDSVLAEARSWFNTDALHFRGDGGRLLGSVFGELTATLVERLEPLIRDGQEDDVGFALAVLSGFGGKPWLYPLVRAAVARLGQENDLLTAARFVLDASPSEGVSGQFGFAELYGERKALVQPWLDDPSEAVRMFAQERVRELDRWIASETRSAETTGALRRLEHGEDLDMDDSNGE